MKELLRGIITIIAAPLVFGPTILVGVVFNLFYPFVMAWKEKNPLTFFRIVWRLIDGTVGTIGEILYQIAEKIDWLGNVWGEWIEDAATTEEATQFGKKGITVSASVGHLEHQGLPMFKRAKVLSRVLNIAFNEKRHALGSWLLHLERERIKKLNLKGKK